MGVQKLPKHVTSFAFDDEEEQWRNICGKDASCSCTFRAHFYEAMYAPHCLSYWLILTK